MADPILQYQSTPGGLPRRTRWWLVGLLLILVPFLVVVLMFAMVMTGIVTPN